MKRSAVLLALIALSACTTVPDGAAKHPEVAAYDSSSDAMHQVDAALNRASASGKRVIVAMGANWCHDSRAFAGWLATPRFRALTDRAFEVVYVDVGSPQTGEARNMDVARRFGVEAIEGTPTVLVLASDATLLNAATARSWRNTASRSEDAIYAELAALAPDAG